MYLSTVFDKLEDGMKVLENCYEEEKKLEQDLIKLMNLK